MGPDPEPSAPAALPRAGELPPAPAEAQPVPGLYSFINSSLFFSFFFYCFHLKENKIELNFARRRVLAGGGEVWDRGWDPGAKGGTQ